MKTFSMCLVFLPSLMLSGVITRVNSLDLNSEDSSTSTAQSEPSCEYLRHIWHFNKRRMQARRAAIQPYVPAVAEPLGAVYAEPAFAYGTWKPAKTRPRTMYRATATSNVYGRVVHSPEEFIYQKPLQSSYRSLAQLAHMVGPSAPIYSSPRMDTPRPPQTFFRLEYPVRRPLPVRVSHIGKFRELQDALRFERAREIQEKHLQQKQQQHSTATNNNGGTAATDSFEQQYGGVADDIDQNRSHTHFGDDVSSSGSASLRSDANDNRQTRHTSKGKLYNTESSNMEDSVENSHILDLEESIPKGWVLGER